MRAAADTLGLQLSILRASSEVEIEDAIIACRQLRAGVLVIDLWCCWSGCGLYATSKRGARLITGSTQ